VPGRAQSTGFGAIGGAPGLRGLKLSVEDVRSGCVAKLAKCPALGVDTAACTPIVCVGSATPWGRRMPAAIVLEKSSAIIRASPCPVLSCPESREKTGE
jgi:hypothetical protein